MDVLVLLDRLEALEGKATPAPWKHAKHDSDFGGENFYSSGHVTSSHHDYAGNRHPSTRRDSVTSPDTMAFNDGEFIAESRNALRDLVAIARAAVEARDAWARVTGPGAFSLSDFEAAMESQAALDRALTLGASPGEGARDGEGGGPEGGEG